MLHIVNKSPFQSSALSSCLRVLQPGSAVLLIEDGVYAGLARNAADSGLAAAITNQAVYALESDVTARGLNSHILDSVTLIDYEGFVELTERYTTSQSWY